MHENELFSKDLDPFYYDTEFIEHTKHKCRFLQHQIDELILQAARVRCSHSASLHGIDKMSKRLGHTTATWAIGTYTQLSCELPYLA